MPACTACGGSGQVRTAPDDRDECMVCDGTGTIDPAPVPTFTEGQRVNTYDGLGVVVEARLDDFYGRGDGGDGFAYRVRLDDGRVSTFDRSRVARV